MGSRGPQKTPTESLARRGSWRAKEPSRQNEINLERLPGPPPAPDWLSQNGREHWEHVSGIVFRHGLMREPDSVAVALLCEAIAKFIQLRDAKTSDMPFLPNGDGGVKRNPLISMQREAMQDVIRLIREMGMSPAARVGLVVDKPGVKMGQIVDKRGGFAT